MRQCLLFLWLQLFASQLISDEVVLNDSRGKELTRGGTVVDYRGDQLTLQLTTGREIVIPADRVIDVKADWLPSHSEADRKYGMRDFASALKLYGEAFNDESRRWVKRKLLARVVRCQLNTGRVTEACKNFARLVSEDRETQYFDAIPLAWSTRQASADLESLARSWIGRDSEPVQRLMAASWLLSSSPDRSSAIDALNDLAKRPADHISGLAMTQLWRTQIVTVKESQLENWRRQIQAIPHQLRGGPYFLLGKTYARFDRPDEAVLALMRLPTLYGDDASLAQSALFESAKLLQESGHDSEAIMLYRETVKWGGETLEATRARQQLSGLLN